jgi:hypothetical protein
MGPGVFFPSVPRTLLASAFTASLLAGCAEPPPEFTALANMIGPPQKRFADGVPAHAGIEPAPVAPPAVPSNEVAAPPSVTETTTTTAVASVSPALVRPPIKDVRELIGLAPTELHARLGDPALRRRDAPAEIWQYRSALCVLDLFLYRDGAVTRVTNVEVRPRDGRDIPAATCLSSL